MKSLISLILFIVVVVLWISVINDFSHKKINIPAKLGEKFREMKDDFDKGYNKKDSTDSI